MRVICDNADDFKIDNIEQVLSNVSFNGDNKEFFLIKCTFSKIQYTPNKRPASWSSFRFVWFRFF